MTNSFRPVLLAVGLASVWCALWAEWSLANLAAGLLIGSAVAWWFRPEPGRIRVVPLVRLLGLVLFDLLASTIAVAREILTPTDRTRESVIEVRVPRESRSHVLVLVVAITLTPGTAVVDADPDTGTLYLHLLHDDRRGAVERHAQQLARLACQALPFGRPSGVCG